MAGELVLIVEDNELNLKLARDVLRLAGYRTLEARTGAEGLALVVAAADGPHPPVRCRQAWKARNSAGTASASGRRSPRASYSSSPTDVAAWGQPAKAATAAGETHGPAAPRVGGLAGAARCPVTPTAARSASPASAAATGPGAGRGRRAGAAEDGAGEGGAGEGGASVAMR
jgi:CheY-like chemotaxis protein